MAAMNMTTATHSAISSSHRMDARFHILENTHAERVASLKRRWTVDEARVQMASLPLSFLEPLQVLMRSAAIRTLDEVAIRREAGRHPFLALALVEEFLPTLRARATLARQAAEDRIMEVDALKELLGLEAPRQKAKP